jgi:hypothetical protein
MQPMRGTISGVRLCWELEEPKGPKGGLGLGGAGAGCSLSRQTRDSNTDGVDAGIARAGVVRVERGHAGPVTTSVGI